MSETMKEMLARKTLPTDKYSMSDGSGGTFDFTIQALSMAQWQDLVDANKPTEEQDAEGLGWNPDTFPAALISSACIEPEISVAEAKQLWSDPSWTKPELLGLLDACVTLSMVRKRTGFALGSD